MSEIKKMDIPFSPPDISDAEIEQVVEALRSGWITTGPKTKQLEKEIAEFLGTNRAACLNSSTAAMEMTLRLLEVGPGDEVIVPAYTYTATCSVVCHVGATPVIVDIQKDVPEFDYDRLGEYITEKTKVIMPVDLAGIPCDYGKLYEVLENCKGKYSPAEGTLQEKFDRVIVLADSSHGFGAEKGNRKTGQLADFTSYSFHAVKNLTTAEGGAITWLPLDGVDDEWIYKQYMNLSLHGQTKDALNKNQLGSWEYDIVSPAYKCNMTDLQAGVGLAQMQRYPEMLDKREAIIKRYNEAFADLDVKVLPHYTEEHRSSGHLYLMRVNGATEEQRNEIIIRLAEMGIATNVHYKPLPMMTAYKNMGFDIKDYPNAYDFYKNEITLPLYTKLTDEQLDYIIAGVRSVLKEI